MTDTMQTEYVLATDAPIAVDVAADIGNARAVILVRVAGETVPIVTELPAVRSLHGAFSWELFASRGLPAASWGSLRSDEHVIERDGVERYLGRLAIERSAAASSGRGSDARYHDGTILEFILAGIAAALPTAARVTARLTTMLPIDLWHLAPRVAQALAGTYRFAYNGRAVVVRIADVAVRREGEAAFAQLSGDTSGRVLIMDIGGRTVNLALFAGGEYRHGKTLELGVEAALDNVDRALLGQGARALSLAERGELLTALLQAESYHITAGHRAVRVDQIARQQLDTTAHALCQEARAKVAVEAAQRVVLIGGGAYGALFGDAIRRDITIAETAGGAALANAYGALGAVQPTKRARGRK